MKNLKEQITTLAVNIGAIIGTILFAALMAVVALGAFHFTRFIIAVITN